jgi:ADP-heptose:LPS heptosyltransferase
VAVKASRPLVLSLRSAGLGDLLTALPALRAVRDAFPRHRHVLITPAPLAPLARHSGTIDDVMPIDGLHALPELDGPVDVAVNLHGRGPQSHRMLRAARPRRLIAFANAAAGVDGPAWREEEHEVERWCRLLTEFGVPCSRERLDLAVPPVFATSAAAEATLIHPGAASAARRWPPDRFAAVARAETRAGREVVVTAGPGEEALAGAVAAFAGLSETNVVTGMDVLGLAATVARAGRVVCGDTGVAHMATAFGVPSVVLFGPEPPARWGPPASGPHHALWAGQRGNAHGEHVDRGLLTITVAQVIAALDEMPVSRFREWTAPPSFRHAGRTGHPPRVRYRGNSAG